MAKNFELVPCFHFEQLLKHPASDSSDRFDVILITYYYKEFSYGNVCY